MDVCDISKCIKEDCMDKYPNPLLSDIILANLSAGEWPQVIWNFKKNMTCLICGRFHNLEISGLLFYEVYVI